MKLLKCLGKRFPSNFSMSRVWIYFCPKRNFCQLPCHQETYQNRFQGVIDHYFESYQYSQYSHALYHLCLYYPLLSMIFYFRICSKYSSFDLKSESFQILSFSICCSH
uniref:Uncharacterized protein n=1 Tax=Cacopsylla melanoneura TaxID=428564 RepID=A0A8D9FG25_9HEMI